MGSYSDVGFHRFVEGRQGPTYELWCEEEAAEGEHRENAVEREREKGADLVPSLGRVWFGVCLKCSGVLAPTASDHTPRRAQRAWLTEGTETTVMSARHDTTHGTTRTRHTARRGGLTWVEV